MKPNLPPRDEALDEQTLALLAEAINPEPLGAAAHERVKRRLLQRVAADTTERHLTVQPGEVGWQPFGEGVQMKVLHEAGGIMSYLVRLAPGAGLPAHHHPVDEECMVLEGEVTIGDLRLARGGFHLGRKDTLHDVLRSEHGALIFLRGAVPDITLVV
jgi:quercetin dioxygenase-like cupin family protein